MKDVDFVPNEKYLEIGNKKYDVSRVSAERCLKAVKVYNQAVQVKHSSELEALIKILDAVLILVRIDFDIQRPFEWFRRRILSKKYIMKNLTYPELAKFCELALDPIIEPKKKEAQRMEKVVDMALAIQEKLGNEQLAELLARQYTSLGLKEEDFSSLIPSKN